MGEKIIAPQFYSEQLRSNKTTQKVSIGNFILKVFSVVLIGEIFEGLVN